MAYIGNLEGWNELTELFKAAGYILDYDMSNEPIVTKIEDGEDADLVEWDDLPENLKNAMIDFGDLHGLAD